MEIKNSSSKRREKIAVVFLSIFISFIFLEAGLRIFGVLYSKRGQQEEKAGAEGAYTILCVGDSYTWGAGAPAEKSYPIQLEKLLNQDGKMKFNVVNRGVGGQNSRQLLNTLQYNLDSVHPDLVIVLVGSANTWNFYGFSGAQGGPGISGNIQNILYRIRIFKLVKLLVMNVRDNIKKSKSAEPQEYYLSIIKKHEEMLNSKVSKEKLIKSRQYLNEAIINFNRHNNEQAVALLQNALKINSGDYKSCIKLGEIYESGDNNEQALKWYKKSLKINPYEIRSYLAICKIYEKQDNFKDAIKYYEKSLEMNPYTSESYMNLAMICADEQQYDASLEWLRKCLDLTGDSSEIYYTISTVYEKKLDYDQAILYLQKALELDINRTTLYEKLSYLYMRKGDYEKALQTCAECLKINSSDLRCLFRMAEVYKEKGEFENALTWFKKIAVIDSTMVFENMGLTYKMMNKPEEAIKCLTKAIKCKPEIKARIEPHILQLKKDMDRSIQMPKKQEKPFPILQRSRPEMRSIRKDENFVRIESWLTRDLLEITEICEKNNVKILMQNFPSYSLFADVIENVAKEKSIPFVDNASVFFNLPENEKYFASDGHCNEDGYFIVAKNLYKKIQEIVPVGR